MGVLHSDYGIHKTFPQPRWVSCDYKSTFNGKIPKKRWCFHPAFTLKKLNVGWSYATETSTKSGVWDLICFSPNFCFFGMRSRFVYICLTCLNWMCDLWFDLIDVFSWNCLGSTKSWVFCLRHPNRWIFTIKNDLRWFKLVFVGNKPTCSSSQTIPILLQVLLDALLITLGWPWDTVPPDRLKEAELERASWRRRTLLLEVNGFRAGRLAWKGKNKWM